MALSTMPRRPSTMPRRPVRRGWVSRPRESLGWAVGIAGTALALYLGIWVMFIGGIAATVDAITADPVEGMDVALGIARIVFASLVGWVVVVGSWLLAGKVGDV